MFGLWSNLGLQTYTGFPAGFGIDQDLGFGAYFGRPVGASSVTITLFELRNDAWREVWSDRKNIEPTDAGFADTLVRFVRPGLYRLDVVARDDLLASALMRMEPPCVRDCSGG